ncbi:hypothetical protein BU26DRAFT_512602 [Trematosphaeria pertusa]|uniref:Uncharacterized protein n=1 Tax=Trematosphaeria pertusa TaxID=390896 RepID=A0A6A6IYK8_9PLEO|nr:uncharacterized protein BU26DRAFT_512602 [Trematosphaeria pertusa]KAF2255635.1 hypothetical protein BU26DRAFT_512602 [Trematosphaeria pertusa]
MYRYLCRYYSKFDLPSGAHIALVICTVPDAKTRPHMVSFTYYPASGSPIFQREHWVSAIERTTTGPGNAFELRIPDMGTMAVDADSTTTYSLSCPEWSLSAMTGSHTPWHPRKKTPEGWLVRLPLPLHWHVHSLSSPTAFQLDIPSLRLPRADRKGRATIHQEKNWASSFPASHMWIQARDGENERGVCLAGGRILGMTAYMLGYRSRDLNVDFVPPFALAVLGFISPFMSVDVDYANRAFEISVSNLFYRIDLKARAPKEGGWFGLGSPFPEGHRRNFCTESFLTEVEVAVFRRGWWGWSEVRKERFENASLEFAGGYFPERGEKRE